jgi:hypothetical protein
MLEVNVKHVEVEMANFTVSISGSGCVGHIRVSIRAD